MKDSAAPRRSGFRGLVRSIARWTARTLALLLTFTLVIALGLNFDGPLDEGPPPLSFTEQAQVNAQIRAADLAVTARELSATGSESTGAYAETAELLQEHAEGLWHPELSPSPPSPVSGSPRPEASATPSPTATGPSPAATEPAPTRTQFVTDLFDSAQLNFNGAVGAEPGIARLLASVGASQRHQAVTLAGPLDLEVPTLDDFPSVEAPSDCTSAQERDPGLAGESETVAPAPDPLAEAVSAEYRSAYAYEVAAARSDDPVPFLELADRHSAAAEAGEELLLSVSCIERPPHIPAYSLDQGFIDDPAGSLAALSTDLVGMYADLVGLTEGPARFWAVQRFSDSADQWHLTTTADTAFPGITE